MNKIILLILPTICLCQDIQSYPTLNFIEENKREIKSKITDIQFENSIVLYNKIKSLNLKERENIKDPRASERVLYEKIESYNAKVKKILNAIKNIEKQDYIKTNNKNFIYEINGIINGHGQDEFFKAYDDFNAVSQPSADSVEVKEVKKKNKMKVILADGRVIEE